MRHDRRITVRPQCVPTVSASADLIPSDPGEVDALAAKLSSSRKSFADPARRLRGLDTSAWSRKTAKGFRTAVPKAPATGPPPSSPLPEGWTR